VVTSRVPDVFPTVSCPLFCPLIMSSTKDFRVAIVGGGMCGIAW